MSCSKGSCQRISRILTRSPLNSSRRSKTRSRLRQKISLKMFKISRKRSRRFKKRLTSSIQNWSRRSQLFSKQISFSDTLFFMRLQATQMSWSEESCELQIQIQGPSPDWRFGVKCQFISQDQQKLGPSHSSNRSRHRWSGMQRSQRMSFSSTIIGWNSSQSMRRSVRKSSHPRVKIIAEIALRNVNSDLAQVDSITVLED